MQETPQAPVHLDVERALEMVGDPLTVVKILGLARDALRRDTERLPALLAAGETTPVAGALHTLKGMLPLFCDDALVQQVVACERVAKAAGAAELAAIYPDLGARLRVLLAEIEAYLAQLPPEPLS